MQLGRAKAVCAACEVRLHCLTFAVATNQEEGVWGGLAPSERRVFRRGRQLRRLTRSKRPLARAQSASVANG